MLHMFFAVPCEAYHVDPVAAEALDLLFILHADHEQNASTSTVRLAGSTGANPYAAISAGVSALWGPAHGGANEAVLAMLEQIGTADNIPKFVARAKDKNSHFRLMGFGHRVYKNFDPRAKIIRDDVPSGCWHEAGTGRQSAVRARTETRGNRAEGRILHRAQALSRTSISTPGIIYSALGIPRSMFTVMFAIARTVGWVAHWQEMISDPAHAHRPAAPALHRADAPRLPAHCRALKPGADTSRPHSCYSSIRARSSAWLARRIGRPSTGLKGAWRMPSRGKTVASMV